MVKDRCQLLNYRRSFLGAVLALAAAICLPARLAAVPQSNELLPLSRVHPGMQGYAYTIFEGDQIENGDRKSTRLNSSHVEISYAVFCLKKKKKRQKVSDARLSRTYAITV